MTARPGFLSRAELAARYAELTGRDLSGIGYYMAFGCFKLAVVLEGIHARFLQNKTVGEGFEREGPARSGAHRARAPDARHGLDWRSQALTELTVRAEPCEPDSRPGKLK